MEVYSAAMALRTRNGSLGACGEAAFLFGVVVGGGGKSCWNRVWRRERWVPKTMQRVRRVEKSWRK